MIIDRKTGDFILSFFLLELNQLFESGLCKLGTIHDAVDNKKYYVNKGDGILAILIIMSDYWVFSCM